MEFSGKNVIVAGGFGGIGSAVCKEFLKRNISNLVILDKVENTKVIDELSNKFPETKISSIYFDITRRSIIDECFRKIAHKKITIDFLVNCVGISNEERPELVIATNLTGYIVTTIMAIGRMSLEKHGHGGVIVNLSSTLGLEPTATHCVYTASKQGIIGFSRALSHPANFEHTGVNVIAVCPGKTETDMLKDLHRTVTLEHGKQHLKSLINVKSQTPEECAKCILSAIEQNKIGGVWMCDRGVLSEVEYPTFWSPEPL